MRSYHSRLCDLAHLRDAWRKISKSNKFSHGFDDQTIKQFGDSLEQNLDGISRDLRNNRYDFTRARGVLIPKDSGGKRPLKIPAVRDRVALKAIELLISPKLRRFDLPCSFGYVPGRSVPDAIKKIRELAAGGKSWVLEADIKKFFDTVNREHLIEQFSRKIRTRSLIPLLTASLRCELGNPEEFIPEDRDLFPDADSGIPQGGILSPLLANFYLHPFDSQMTRDGFDLVRYADDFVVMCATEPEALRAYTMCVKILEEQLNLEMHHIGDPESKTRIFQFSKGFKFLGMQFQGATVFPTSKKIECFREKVEAIVDPRRGLSLLKTLLKLSNLVYGWANAYRICDDGRIYSQMDDLVRKATGAFLRRHSLLEPGRNLNNLQMKFLGIPSIVVVRRG